MRQIDEPKPESEKIPAKTFLEIAEGHENIIPKNRLLFVNGCVTRQVITVDLIVSIVNLSITP